VGSGSGRVVTTLSSVSSNIQREWHCIAWSCWCTIKELLGTMEWCLLWLKYFDLPFLRHLIAVCFPCRAPRAWFDQQSVAKSSVVVGVEMTCWSHSTMMTWRTMWEILLWALHFLARSQTYFTVLSKRKYLSKTVKTTTIYNVTFKMSQVNWRSVSSSSSSYSFVTVQ